MGKNIDLNLDDMIIWSDNPRCGYTGSKQKMTERQAVNILIEVVSEEKMFNLAESIVKFKGLAKNSIPTVVRWGKKYFVYDGNRRVSCLKMIVDPEIIDSDSLKKKIINLKKNVDLSFCQRINVYSTNEEEALELMDLTHSGEQNGVGVLPWNAFNKDLSYYQRNLKPTYPISFKIVNILNWKTKTDFKKIPYTDFQRIFSSKALLDFFSITNIDINNKKQIKEAVDYLLAYQTKIGFASFSRQFNILNTDSIDQPMSQFLNYVKTVRDSKNKYILKIENFTVFNDEEFSFRYDKIKIVTNDDKQEEITFNKDDISISFITPLGRLVKNINLRMLGDWKAQVEFEGISATCCITVEKPLREPDVLIDDKILFKKGQTYDLSKLVQRKFSIHKNDMEYSINSIGTNQAIIKGNIFSSENDVGVYQIQFKFNNDGIEYAQVITVRVDDRALPMKAKYEVVPFVCSQQITINFSNSVAKLVDEINSIFDNPNYEYIIVASIRSVAELSFDYLKTVPSFSGFSNLSDLKTKIDEAKAFLLSKLQQITTGTQFSFHDIQNKLTLINADNLNAVLNVAAHKSGDGITKEYMLQYCKNDLSTIIVCCQLIKNSGMQ